MKRLIIFITGLIGLAVNSYGHDLDHIMEAVIQVESGGNPRAKSGIYVGVLQISPITIKECNRIVGHKKYTNADRWCPIKSREIWRIIQRHHNPERNPEKAIRLWKGGPGYTMRGTERYYRKVMKHLR